MKFYMKFSGRSYLIYVFLWQTNEEILRGYYRPWWYGMEFPINILETTLLSLFLDKVRQTNDCKVLKYNMETSQKHFFQGTKVGCQKILG